MNTEIKCVHLEITEKIKAYINKKMQRLDFAKDYLVDLLFSLTREKRRYKIEVNINFRWGNSNHIGINNFDIFEGIDNIFDKMELKIIKEKRKVQHHKGKTTVRSDETILEQSQTDI